MSSDLLHQEVMVVNTNEDTAPVVDSGANSAAEQTFTQEQVNSFLAEQKRKISAGFSDYNELKAKAAKFDEFQEASKSELQRVQERAQQLEAELASERERAGKASVAAAKGVPASALTGSTVEEWEASADALLEWRASQSKTVEKQAKPSRGLKSGVTGNDQPLTPQEQAAAALRAFRSQE